MGDAAAGAGNTNGSATGGTGILGLLSEVFSNIESALSRTVSGNEPKFHRPRHGDRYVNGDTNWDGYDLPSLVSMVASPASPSQVDTVAGLWRSNGAAISQSADNLSNSLATLMNYWSGSAADSASSSVSGSSGWITAVGDTASKMAEEIENASGALQSAQNNMPGQPTNSFWTAYNTAADGSTAGAAGGPFGAAAGTMVGGLASVFTAGSSQTAMKQQAVQTMQRFEQAAVSIDTGTPLFQTPPSWGTASASTAGGVIPNFNIADTGPTLPGGASGLSTLPSFADSPIGRWNALTGGIGGAGGGGFGTGGVGSVGGSGGDVGLFGGGMFGVGGLGKDEERSGSAPMSGGAISAAAREEATAAGMVGRTGMNAEGLGAAGIMEEVDGAGAGGMMPMGGGMMGGMGARGGSDGEHRRRIPIEEDPFLTGLKAAPRVIGLSSLDREDDK